MHPKDFRYPGAPHPQITHPGAPSGFPGMPPNRLPVNSNFKSSSDTQEKYDRAVAAHLGVEPPHPSTYEPQPKLTPEEKIDADKIAASLSTDEKLNQVFKMLTTITEHMTPTTQGLGADIQVLEKRIDEIALAQSALSAKLKTLMPTKQMKRRVKRKAPVAPPKGAKRKTAK